MFTNIEKLVGAATELERVLGELGETPYEPLREEQEDRASETMMENTGNCIKQHTYQFLQGDCTQSKGIIFFHCVWKMPNL
jgi:hypothetical protein